MYGNDSNANKFAEQIWRKVVKDKAVRRAIVFPRDSRKRERMQITLLGVMEGNTKGGTIHDMTSPEKRAKTESVEEVGGLPCMLHHGLGEILECLLANMMQRTLRRILGLQEGGKGAGHTGAEYGRK